MLVSAEEFERKREPGPVPFLPRLDLPSREPTVRPPPRATPPEQAWQPLFDRVEEFLREVTCYPPGRRLPPQRVVPSGSDAIEAEINALYREVRRLIPQAATDPQAEIAYQDALRRLRDLEEREAEKWSFGFHARRALAPGEGYAALRRADALIAKYADLASADRTAQDADHPTPPARSGE
jgi:hypothetical protein